MGTGRLRRSQLALCIRYVTLLKFEGSYEGLIAHSQVPFAEQIKKEVPELVVGSPGLITVAEQAGGILQVRPPFQHTFNHISTILFLQENKTDVLMLDFEMLRRADFALDAAQELGVVMKPANQYERAWTRIMKSRA